MRTLRYVVATCVAAAFPAVAQVSPVTGTVVDSATGNPVAGALVALVGNGYVQAVSSRDDGAFRFTNVTPGSYTMSVRRLGFAALQLTIPIDANGVHVRAAVVRIAALDTVRANPGTGIAGEVGALTPLRPLANAEVLVVGVGAVLRTDSTGRFFLPLRQAGTYVVRAKSPGYLPVALSVRVTRDSTARVMLLMDTATAGISSAYELAWREFADRARLRGTKSALVSHGELARTGEPGLMDALQRVPSLSAAQLHFGETVCVFINGRPAAGSPLAAWDVGQVEVVEVYTGERRSEETGSLRRASRGYECQPTRLRGAVPPPRDRIRWLVIWVKS